jgi:hypothetical protein
VGEPKDELTKTVERQGTRYDFAFVGEGTLLPISVYEGDVMRETDDAFTFTFASGVVQVVLKRNLLRYQVYRFTRKVRVPAPLPDA